MNPIPKNPAKGCQSPEITLASKFLCVIKSILTRKRLAMSTTTGFFRNIPQLETLGKLSPSASKAYCFGCSTGCEAYSLAIFYQSVVGNRSLEVNGFDIDRVCVEKARKGIYGWDEIDYYGAWAVLPEYVETNFNTVGLDSYQVDKSIMRRCTFEVGSVLDSDLLSSLPKADLVLCQNVMIHMRKRENQIVIENLLKVLLPNGLLVIGGMRPSVRCTVVKNLALDPVTDNAELIHEGWLDLREWWDRTPPWKRKYYCIEPMKIVKDWKFRYCTIFRKL